MLVRLRFSRAAATSSKALNRGETRKLIETVFSAAIVVVVLYRGLPYMTASACESTSAGHRAALTTFSSRRGSYSGLPGLA